MLARIAAFLLVGFLCAGGIALRHAEAQSLDSEARVLAQFQDARALAVDPLGRLYVADAGRDAVVILGPDGRRQTIIGGSGTRAGEFDTPSDVDPTNGQVLLVADTYNGRVQRFSEEGQYLESLPIGRGEGLARGFDDGRDGSAVQGNGRPVAVASNSHGTTFILDERDGVLLRWSELQGMDRIVDGLAGGRDRLEDPVALTVGAEGHLYVADAAQEAILVFDRFGTYLRRLPTPSLPNVRALTWRRGRLWIVESDRLWVWERSSRRANTHPISVNNTLQDVVPTTRALYILTSTHLIQKSR